MKKLLSLFITLSWLQMCSPATAQIQIARNFWDLKSSKTYSNARVNAFDSTIATGIGGGEFAWIVTGNNSTIKDIAGIQIKSKYNARGYWRRIYSGAVQVDWAGGCGLTSQKTFSEYGYTQAKLDSIYGTICGNGLITTSWRPDEAAIQATYRLQENIGYQAIEFSPRPYYYWHSPYAARTVNISSPVDRAAFRISGNGSNWYAMANGINFLNHSPSSQTEAAGWLNPSFNISNITCWGNGFTGVTFMTLDATYQSYLLNLVSRSCNTGISLRWSMGCKIIDCEGNNNTYADLIIDRAFWTGADYSNSQSNADYVLGFRSFNSGTYGTIIGDASNTTIDTYTLEGASGGAAKYGIWFNSRASSLVKDLDIRNLYGEGTYDSAAVYIRAGDGLYSVDRVFFRNTINLVWFAAADDSYPQVNLSNVVYWPSTQRLVSQDYVVGNNNCCWNVVNLNKAGINTVTDLINPASNVFSTSISGTSIPIAARCSVTKKIVN